VFTFGKCRFNDNIPGKFWLRDDKVRFVSCGDEHTVIVAGNVLVNNYTIIMHSHLSILVSRLRNIVNNISIRTPQDCIDCWLV